MVVENDKIEFEVFPAYAGMFRPSQSPKKQFSSFPRIRGDVPIEKITPMVTM